jgi:hypothetical protein
MCPHGMVLGLAQGQFYLGCTDSKNILISRSSPFHSPGTSVSDEFLVRPCVSDKTSNLNFPFSLQYNVICTNYVGHYPFSEVLPSLGCHYTDAVATGCLGHPQRVN